MTIIGTERNPFRQTLSNGLEASFFQGESGLYSGTIRWPDGDISGTIVNTKAEIDKWLSEKEKVNIKECCGGEYGNIQKTARI